MYPGKKSNSTVLYIHLNMLGDLERLLSFYVTAFYIM